jgi:hypothetical protein
MTNFERSTHLSSGSAHGSSGGAHAADTPKDDGDLHNRRIVSWAVACSFGWSAFPFRSSSFCGFSFTESSAQLRRPAANRSARPDRPQVAARSDWRIKKSTTGQSNPLGGSLPDGNRLRVISPQEGRMFHHRSSVFAPRISVIDGHLRALEKELEKVGREAGRRLRA